MSTMSSNIENICSEVEVNLWQELTRYAIVGLLLVFTLLTSVGFTYLAHFGESVILQPSGSAVRVSTVLKHHKKRQIIYERLGMLVQYLNSTRFSDESELRSLTTLRNAETHAIDKIIQKYWSEAPELISILNNLQRFDSIYWMEWEIHLNVLRKGTTLTNRMVLPQIRSFETFIREAATNVEGVVKKLPFLKFSRGIFLMNNTIFWRSLHKKIFRRELLYANAFLVPLPINHQHHQMRKVLVLDLDETLIHAYRFQSPRYEVNVNMPPDFFVTINRDRYCVHRRPYVDFFLDTVSRWYKLVVFTAATEEYGQGVMKHLDGGRNILNTLYHRKNLTFLNGVKTKDLSIISPNLSSILIIDNLPDSFILNPDNAIPIKSWYLDSMDAALVDLLPMLDCLLFTQDVRSVLSRRRQHL